MTAIERPTRARRTVTVVAPDPVTSVLLTLVLLGCGGSPAEVASAPPRDAPRVNRISVGTGHTCAIAASGRVVCWGSYADETPSDAPPEYQEEPRRFPPTEVDTVERAVEVRAGAGFTCARDAAGAVWCWGNDDWGATPGRVRGLRDATRISAGTHHACAIHAGGALACWGPTKRAAPLDVGARVTAAGVANGAVCASLEAGPLRCFAIDVPSDEAPPVTLLDAADAGDVEEVVMFATDDPTLRGCVRRRDGTAESFFHTDRGTLHAPAPAEGIVSLGVGTNQSCAAVSGGALRCWEGRMQFGFGFPPGEGASDDEVSTYLNELFAQAMRPSGFDGIEAIDDVVEVGIGNYHRCLVRRDGRVSCWGQNFNGGLGVIPFLRRDRAAAVPGIDDARHLFTTHYETCAVRAGDRVTCWPGAEQDPFHELTLPTAGFEWVSGPCARFDDGHLRCLASRPYLLDFGAAGMDGLIAYFEQRACALGPSGPIRCRRGHREGEETRAEDEEVEELARPGEVIALAAAGGTTYALLADGGVACRWGGDGALAEAPRIPGVEGMIGVTAHRDDACAWSADGRVTCFQSCPRAEEHIHRRLEVPGVVEVALFNGDEPKIAVRRSQGGVLYGTLEPEGAELREVEGLPADLAQVVVGYGYGCARARDGTVHCWGTNGRGQLGVPSHESSYTPIDVPGVRL